MRKMLVPVVAVTALALVPNTAGPAPGAQQQCTYRVVYEGTVYRGSAPGAEAVRSGARVGPAVRLPCDDIGGRPPEPGTPIDVFRFGTASPWVALTTRELGRPAIVAVSGRCFGFGRDTDGYLRCLQTEVRFRGRGYTGTRGAVLPRGSSIGQGRVDGRPLPLRAIQGIDPRIALAPADDPELILVAHRRCHIWPYDRTLETFMRCLRAPLWLAIRGHTRTRTATVKLPGSLLTSVQMRLLLAPDGIADQISSPDDTRLTPAGRLRVDRKGRGRTRIAIADSLGVGRYAVLAQLPGRRMVVVGVLALNA